MKKAIDKLIDAIKVCGNPTCAGLDTAVAFLPPELQAQCTTFSAAANAVYEFNCGMLDAFKGVVPAVKVQIAYYEMLGTAGVKAFEKTVKQAKKEGFIVIADAKRNDIGSTAKCYSSAFLGTSELAGVKKKAPFDSDFLTVNPYLGSDGIVPFTEDCAARGKGLFALVKTSNPGSSEFQDKTFSDGKTLYMTVGESVAAWGKSLRGKYGYSSVGAVVGATHPAQAEALRKALPSVFFLIPGYGAQGGKAEDLKVCFDSKGLGGIVNSSRALLTAYRADKYKGLGVYAAARAAAEDMRDDLGKFI